MSRIQKYERMVEAEALAPVSAELVPQSDASEQSRVRHLRLVQPEAENSVNNTRPSLMRMLMDAGEYGVDPYGNTLPSEQRDML